MASSDDDKPLSTLVKREVAAEAPKPFVIPKKSRSGSSQTVNGYAPSASGTVSDGGVAAKKITPENSANEFRSSSDTPKGSLKTLKRSKNRSEDVKIESEVKPIKNKRRKDVIDSSEDESIKRKPKKTKSKAVKEEEVVTVKKEPEKKEGVVKPEPKLKKLSKIEQLELAIKAFKWWEAPALARGLYWNNLEHCGMAFPDEYVPHGIPMVYDGKEVIMDRELEELITFFADLPDNSPQLKDAASKKTFERNFWEEVQNLLPLKHPLKDGSFSKCDFTDIKQYLREKKIIKKAATTVEKEKLKQEKEIRQHQFGFCIVNDHLERVGNYAMEPPGLFKGRGLHPKVGKFKQRAYPNQVTINIGESAKVPKCTIPGFAWKRVQHDPSVAWLCTWKENILRKSDVKKYDKAIQLKEKIGEIRMNYESGLTASDIKDRQISTAMWLIDKLALRVGGEKDSEEEADTVGCCTLRVEHMTFKPVTLGRLIDLEFLGKDSMRFKQTINFDAYDKIGKLVYENLKKFCKSKNQDEQVFANIDPMQVNKHLQQFMPGLSAKVFRTYNASETLQNQLPSTAELEGKTVQEKVIQFNNANREVAILCNHQKTVSSAAVKSFEMMNEKFDTLKNQLDELRAWEKLCFKNKENTIPLKFITDSGVDVTKEEEQVKQQAEEAKHAKEKAKTTEEKVRATQLMDEVAARKKEVTQMKFNLMHRFAATPSIEQVRKKIAAWESKVEKMKHSVTDKEQNKEVALETSKVNYMDPRITVAFCKRNEIPIDKIFAKTLRDKFVWAMHVPPDWRFEPVSTGAKEKSKTAAAK